MIAPDGGNGLENPSWVMTHRLSAIRKSDIGGLIGTLSVTDLERIDAAVALLLGLH
jgi:hypothetical protein